MKEGKTKRLGMCWNVLAGMRGTRATMPPNQGNHWVAVVVDAGRQRILFANPFEGPIPLELKALLQWWIRQHIKEEFAIGQLESEKQALGDTFSCGVIAANAVAHDMQPLTISLLPSSTVAAIIHRCDQAGTVINLIRERQVSVHCKQLINVLYSPNSISQAHCRHPLRTILITLPPPLYIPPFTNPTSPLCQTTESAAMLPMPLLPCYQ